MKLAYNIVIGTHDKDPEDFFYCVEYPEVKGKCKNYDFDDIEYYLRQCIDLHLLEDRFLKIKLPMKNPELYVQKHYKNFHIKEFLKIELDAKWLFHSSGIYNDAVIRHTKSKTLYKVLDFAVNANNSGPEDIQVVYCLESNPDRVYVRSLHEMLDYIPEEHLKRFENIIFEEDY